MQAALQLTKGDCREWWERQRKSLVASCHLWRMLPLHAILVGHKTSQETAPIPVIVCLNCCHLADATDLPKFTQADLETVSFRELYTSWKVIYTKYHCTQISLYAALQFLHFKFPLVFIIILYLYLFLCVFTPQRCFKNFVVCPACNDNKSDSDWCIFAGFQYKNGRESMVKTRDIAAFEVVPLSKPRSTYRACCTLWWVTLMFLSWWFL